jgi:hypothetical protein
MRLRLILALALAAPAPALAQSWQVYSYPDQGFAFQLPVAPTVSDGAAETWNGQAAPVRTYSAQAPGIVYTLAIVDLSKTGVEGAQALVLAEKALGDRGKVAVAVNARINRQYGRELTLDANDGSRLTAALFVINQHLYRLTAQALPPNPQERSSAALHFQQSLEFLGESRGFGGEGFGYGGFND